MMAFLHFKDVGQRSDLQTNSEPTEEQAHSISVFF